MTLIEEWPQLDTEIKTADLKDVRCVHLDWCERLLTKRPVGPPRASRPVSIARRHVLDKPNSDLKGILVTKNQPGGRQFSVR